MKLRDHPLMNYYGSHNWPPAWISLNGREDRMSTNEVGLLLGAKCEDCLGPTFACGSECGLNLVGI